MASDLEKEQVESAYSRKIETIGDNIVNILSNFTGTIETQGGDIIITFNEYQALKELLLKDYEQPISLNGYFPLFKKESMSNLASYLGGGLGTSHIHIFEDETYYMPEGILNYHGVHHSNEEIDTIINSKLNNLSLRLAVSEWVNNRDEAISEYGEINTWDTSRVTDMSFLFNNYSNFNDSISKWDVSNVISMKGMFRNASSFNQNINEWDTRGVQNMENMFEGAVSFNHSIEQWDLSSLSASNKMFLNAISINQPFHNFMNSGIKFFGSNGNILSFPGDSDITVSDMFLGASSQTIKGNFCLPKGTPVLTDQGIVSIEDINCEHTINNKKVNKLLSFINNDPYMVLIKKNALGFNSPSEDTQMSMNHGIYIREHVIRAKALINNKTIVQVKLSSPQIVYNVLLEGKKHKMPINNIEVETMCPKSYNKINGIRYLKSIENVHPDKLKCSLV